MGHSGTAICLSPAADGLQKLAAAELKGYLRRLFGLEAEIVAGPAQGAGARFVLGLASDPFMQRAAGELPKLSQQGHLVRRTSAETMVLAGGSSAAVAWAAYELVERYGVRFLLHEDVFPDEPGPFRLPDVDALFEPVQKLRSWRQFNDLPTGPGLWTLQQQRLIIRQLFKLKFNSVYFALWPHHPFVDYEVDGIRRERACLLFGQKIPIDEDTIGREHLGDMPLLGNPEFLGAESFAETLAAGKRLIHSLIDLARSLGMHTAIGVQPMEFPLEFKPLLEQPSEPGQLGSLVISERGDLTNADHMALIRAKLGGYLDEYGEVDEVILGVPEHPQADLTYRQCWDELAAKYGLEPQFNIDELVAGSQRNYLTPGGPQRAEREFKSAVSMLHFFDHFMSSTDLLQQADARGVAVGLNVGTGGVEAFPFIDRVLWPGATIGTNLDYTSSRAVRRLHYMEQIDASKVPASLVVTLQDDNIGSLPQVATENIHHLLQKMHQLGWRGYFTRFWPIGDLDPTVAYLARASWDVSLSPRAAYADHFAHVYGAQSVEPLCQVMRMLEDVTVILDLDFLSLLFPVLGIMEGFVRRDRPMDTGLFHVRATYEQARRILERLIDLPGPSARDGNLAYWTGRLDFSIHALREVELLCAGGCEVAAAKQSYAAPHLERAREFYGRAVAEGEAALTAWAGNVRDESDSNSLAAYYHFLVREVKQQTQEALRSSGAAEGGEK